MQPVPPSAMSVRSQSLQVPASLTSEANTVSDNGIFVNSMTDDSVNLHKRTQNITIASVGQVVINPPSPASQRSPNLALFGSSFTSSTGSLETLDEIRSLQLKNGAALNEPAPNSGRGDRQLAAPDLRQSFGSGSTKANADVSNRIRNTSETNSAQPNQSKRWLSHLRSCRERAGLAIQFQNAIYGQLIPYDRNIRPILFQLQSQMVICRAQHENIKQIDELEIELEEHVDVQRMLEKVSKNLFNATKELQDLDRAIRELFTTTKREKSLIRNLKALDFPMGGTQGERRTNRYGGLLEHLQRIKPSFLQFQDLCTQLSDIQQLRQQEPLTKAEKEMMSRFEICQKATSLLYQQLCQVCYVHKEHQVYFNLRVNDDLKQTTPVLDFHLAFKAASHRHNSTNLIWFRATSTLMPLDVKDLKKLNHWTRESRSPRSRPNRGVSKRKARPTSRSTRQTTQRKPSSAPQRQTVHSNSRSTSALCLSNYGQGFGHWAADLADLPAMTDFDDLTLRQNRLNFPEMPPRIDPVPLSQWIREGCHVQMPDLTAEHMRIHVARVLCEALLRFTPKVWPQTPFSSENIMILDSINGGVWDPHFTLKLVGRNGSEQYLSASGGTPSREILHQLGITLLELAHRKLVHGLRTNDAGEIDRGHSSYAQVTNLCGTSLKSVFGGTHFPRAVDYCIKYPSRGKDLLDSELRERFYKAVVVSLEKTEKSISRSLDNQRRFAEDR
ncbi:hypothetical protein FVEG_01569 [Fusarium verticillioides 7600]|uniref:Uncharacterized protein n=1 Tax=Gibberella moniliformis (strain M3125 / FGSC 7600) TaxID=334819 RepID=W7LS25_GIBM7|nr:hypothetical protein FVEG_01569 [Fusarium verticillioides 7600]EWG38314.1 hypothetical protein FVEG_01569 [Fusarium verticillioides 7600]